MSTDAPQFKDALEATRSTIWSFDLNSPPNPEGDGTGYVCPAEGYIDFIRQALELLTVAKLHALDEIPERIHQRIEIKSRSSLAVIEEMSTQEPEVRRYWAVSEVQDLVRHLSESLLDEARPHPRVVLPKLVRRRRTS